jgi:tRNA(adenine34) deaminase
VIDLFALPQLNHRSRVRGGLLASECGALLRDFFREKRRASARRHPLREDALRTPDHAFAAVPEKSGESPSYLQEHPALEGLRMHYRDCGPLAPGPGDSRQGGSDWLCLHGPMNWSQRFGSALRTMGHAGLRAVAPDLIGFGRSDKPKRESFHETAWHVGSLKALVEALDLRRIVVVVEESHRMLGQRLVDTEPVRYRGLVVLQELDADRPPVASWHADAPFPDRGHRAGLRALGGGSGRGARKDAAPSRAHAAAPVPILWAGIDRADPENDTAWLAQAMKYFAS